jgi:hypothetical protein
MKPPRCTPYSLKAFQWYEEHGGGHHGSGDFNVMNKTYKMNKQPSLIYRFFFNDFLYMEKSFWHVFLGNGACLVNLNDICMHFGVNTIKGAKNHVK